MPFIECVVSLKVRWNLRVWDLSGGFASSLEFGVEEAYQPFHLHAACWIFRQTKGSLTDFSLLHTRVEFLAGGCHYEHVRCVLSLLSGR